MADFGEATPFREGRTLTLEVGTLMYRAPEMVDLHRGKRIDHRVDVWALGTLLYTLALQAPVLMLAGRGFALLQSAASAAQTLQAMH